MIEASAPRVFLDLDGTVTDAGQAITTSIRHACAAVERPLAEDAALDWCIGPPLLDSLTTLLGHDEVLAAHALEVYRAHYSAGGMLTAPVYPGIENALERMRAAGWRMFLATSKPHVYARLITVHHGLNRFLEGEFGAELDGTRGNKPDLLAYALAQTGQGAAAMIGDRRYDIEGAKANGIHAIGVLWGYGSRDELTEAGADLLLETPRALADAVAGCLE